MLGDASYSWCSSQSSNASSACFLLWIEQLLICWIFSNYSWICGKLPCSNSNNYASDSDLGWIYCGGDRSCMKFSYLQCWWPWYTIKWSSCCTKHNFYSTLISVEFIFYGENTTIICSDANTCNVECYNNACDNLNLTCAGASCTFNCQDYHDQQRASSNDLNGIAGQSICCTANSACNAATNATNMIV